MPRNEAPTMLRLNDEAYERWNGGDLDGVTTKLAFWVALTPLQRDAVVLTNLIGQVRNGGFAQWHTNRFSAATPMILDVLGRMPQSEVVGTVRGLVERAAEAIKNGDFDEWAYDEGAEQVFAALDADFYAIDEAFLEAAEAFFQAHDYEEARA